MTQTETYSSEVAAMYRAWWLLRKGNTVKVNENTGITPEGKIWELPTWELEWEIAPTLKAAYICSGCGVTVPVGDAHGCLIDTARDQFQKILEGIEKEG